MPEENQIQTSQGAAPVAGSIKERLAGIRDYRTQAKLARARRTQNELDQTANTMFDQSLNVNSPELSKKYNQASQSTAVASMIKSYAERNGDDWSDLNTPNEILAEYYRLNPDDETYNRITEFTQSDRDPEEFGMEMGWVERTPIQMPESDTPEETFMDKAKTGIVGPFARAVGALGGAVGGLGQGIADASKRPGDFDQWQLDRGYVDEGGNAVDINLKQAIKWYGKFFGTLGNMLGDVVGGTMMGAAKGFTTNQEQDAVGDKVAEVAAAILNSEPGEKVQAMYNSLDDNQKQELKDWASIIDGLADLPLSMVGGKVIKQGIKQTIKAGESEFLERGIKSIDNIVDSRATKRAIKNKAANIDEIRRVANVIGQGETSDIDNSIRALKSILGDADSSEIKTFADLRKAGESRVERLSRQVDDNLSKQTGKITLADQHIVNVNGESQGRYIEDAIEDLKDIYTKQRDPEKLNKVFEFENKVSGDGVTYKELNDFAREYGSTTNAWNNKNQLTTDAKVGAERTRSGIKDIIQERMPDAEFRDIDAEIGSVANFNKLVDKTVEKVNDVEKKLRDKGLLESTREAWSDFKSAIRGDLRGDTQNIYRVQRGLPEKLEIFNSLSKDIDKATTAEEALDLLKKANQDIRVGLTTVKGYEDQPFDGLVDLASDLESKGDFAGAKETLDKALETSEKDIKDTLGDSLVSIEKTVGRYGSNEPTFFLKVNNDSPATIKKIADIAKKYKQNSFFTAKKVNSSTPYGPIAGKPGTAIEPGVIIRTEKSIDNMSDFDNILKSAGFDGATLLPGGKGIELYNLSQFGGTPESTVEGIKKLMNNKQLIDKYGIADINDGKFEIMHIGMKQSGRPDWAGNQQGLGTYDDLSNYLKSLSNK